jgi:alpha-N-arabinofuranosidase
MSCSRQMIDNANGGIDDFFQSLKFVVRRSIIAALFSFTVIVTQMSIPQQASAQYTTNVPIYANAVVGGFQDWSWATRNLSETSTVYPGCTDAIQANFGPNTALSFHSSNVPGNQFSSLSFYVNGGTTGGQNFTVQINTASNANTPALSVTNYISGGQIPPNKWILVTIPLSDLGVSNAPDIDDVEIYNGSGNTLNTLYFDQIVLNGPIPPSSVAITADATQAIRTVDQRHFGVNTAIWDGIINSQSTESLLQSAGTGVIRIPGGSASDGYDWTSQSYSGQTMTPQFANLAAALGAQTYVTVNYGSGTPQEAAAWVAYCNSAVGASYVNIGYDSKLRNWYTAQYWATLRSASPLATDDGMNFLRVHHSAPFGFHNWEIGNEIYGSWEYDTHVKPNDPVTYGNLYVQFKNAMKAIDPTISVGAVITADEDSYPASGESVTNPVTGVSHSGWTAILFSTLASLGVAPDSVSLHNYGNGGSPYSDPIVLHYPQQWTTTATGIRTMLTDYFGASNSASVQLANTESNTTGYNTGKQMTSIVDGLYYADFEGALMQTEFVGNIWWDLHNGADTSGVLDPSLYGWRLYADYGVLSVGSGNPGDLVANTPYPAYYAMKLISKFARSGDTVVAASSSYINLTAYAVQQANGTLALLVVNKDPNRTVPATIALNGFYSAPTATLYQYGLAQDTAQSHGQSVDLARTTVAAGGISFAQEFPPYSMSVLQLSPGVPPLTASPSSVSVLQKTSSPVSINLSNVTGFSGSETLSATGLPTGVTASFAPASISGTGTSTLTFTAAVTAPAGTTNVTITGTSGSLTTTITLPLTVVYNPILTSITVSPATAALTVNTTQQFTASGNDQFGDVLASQPAFTWTLGNNSVGTISSSGYYSSGLTVGTATVLASSGSVTGTASVMVSPNVLGPFILTPIAPSNGSLLPSTPQTVSLNGTASFTETPNSGYLLASWSVDGTIVTGTTTLVDGTVVTVVGSSLTFSGVQGNHTFTAAYSELGPYTLTPETVTNGSLSPSTVQTVNFDGTKSFTATGTLGYGLTSWSVDGAIISGTTTLADGTIATVVGSTLTFTEVQGNHTLSAAFGVLGPYTLTPGPTTNGSLTPNAAQTVNFDGSQSFTESPSSIYVFGGWSVDGISVTGTSTLGDGTIVTVSGSTVMFSNVQGSHALSATFSKPPTLHTFPTGLMMISAPVDDSSYSLPQIFDETVKFAVWSTSTSAYVINPAAPADTIRPGQGYWARFTTATNLFDLGTTISPSTVVSLPLTAGWNQIGDPRTTAVNSNTLSIQISGQTYSLNSAVAAGLIDNNVYTYQVGDSAYEITFANSASLQPFAGYWLYSSQAGTLVYPAQ